MRPGHWGDSCPLRAEEKTSECLALTFDASVDAVGNAKHRLFGSVVGCESCAEPVGFRRLDIADASIDWKPGRTDRKVSV